VKKKLIQI